MYLGEVIGVSILLGIALIVAITLLIAEMKDEIEDIKRRNHWRRWNKRRR